jgi:hypothetical protein
VTNGVANHECGCFSDAKQKSFDSPSNASPHMVEFSLKTFSYVFWQESAEEQVSKGP